MNQDSTPITRARMQKHIQDQIDYHRDALSGLEDIHNNLASLPAGVGDHNVSATSLDTHDDGYIEDGDAPVTSLRTTPPKTGKRRLSAAGRAAIAKATKARWARYRKQAK
jgi:hypothetical protein